MILIASLGACALDQKFPVPASGNVTLPLEEYNHLTELAAHPPKPDATPFPHILKSAFLNLHVNPESVSGVIQIDGEVLAKGERKVPLVSGMIVLDAQQRGKDLPLEQESGTHLALLSGPGEFSVTLDAAVPLSIETGRASFNLPVPAAGAARLVLAVPGDQTQVVITPGIITARSSQNGQTIIEATLVPGQNASVWWASRLKSSATPSSPKEVRFLSEVRSLVSVSEADLVLAALLQVTVVQGEPAEFRLQCPQGYELTGASGATLLSSDLQANRVELKVGDATVRTHEFLITLVKANTNITKAEVPLITFEKTQRETGEVLVEGDGAMELTATEKGGLRRMDLKETSPYLRSLSRATLQAAFQYQKRPAETPAVALEWVRFADSRVLSAVAQHAEITTLITSEGRSLTEIKLNLKNQSQPFLKVALPAGATILSAEVAGEKVKPVEGSDGSRVPLLRPGFRPAGAYVVSFVILNPEASFAKKGTAALALPSMDIPIGQMNWEVFLPQQFKVANFSGDAAPAHLFPVDGEGAARLGAVTSVIDNPGPNQLGGVVTDPSGAVVTNARITVTQGSLKYTAITGPNGRWAISGLPSGTVNIWVESPGFQSNTRNLRYDSERGSELKQTLNIGSVSETVEVTVQSSPIAGRVMAPPPPREAPKDTPSQDTSASTNVADLQKKVVGVLPIAINIPRTGNSYRFLRTLVVDEETKLGFAYTRR
jgi:hypothetical protein